MSKSITEIIESNKKLIAERPELKNLNNLLDYTLDQRKTWAKDFAAKLVELYPHLETVEDVMDKAKEDGRFETANEALMVWGRLNHLLPNRAFIEELSS